MGDRGKTSQAGSLATTLSEKLKIAGAKTSGGDQKEINVAIIKATTNQFHVVPKEKHVRTLKLAVHSSRGKKDVHHIITELHRRLQDATDWLTALKTLITLHRLVRESEPSFMDELAKYSEGLNHPGHGGAGGVTVAPVRVFSTDNFVDRTSSEGRFDFSEWVRAYGKYLNEQLAVWLKLRWYVEQETPGTESRFRTMPPRDLLFQLPHVQRLQRRLLDCVPRGAAMHDPVVLFSLSLVVKESFKVYKAVSEGIINLADAFFEMEFHDATRGLEYYKEGVAASDALSGYYATIEQLEEIKRTMQLPKLSAPPADFLRSMEAYLAEAPRPMPADGDAPAATKKGVPLRKGRLLSSKSAAAGAAIPAGTAASSDPGMVLPMPRTVSNASAGAAASQEASSPDTAGAAGAPTTNGAHADKAADDLPADSAGAAAQKPAPSPLDLLSDLDFSFGAPAASVAGGAAPSPAPAASANPFAELSSEPAPAAFLQPSETANPFGDPGPTTAAGSGAAAYSWPPAPSPAAQAPQQTAWAAPQLQPQLYSQPAYGAPSPSPSAHSHAVVSDDPFAGFGAPSPAVAPAYSGSAAPGGGSWATQSPGAAPYGAGAAARYSPGAGNELSKAALHDPFAALTGLPNKTSPGNASNRPSPPRAAYY